MPEQTAEDARERDVFLSRQVLGWRWWFLPAKAFRNGSKDEGGHYQLLSPDEEKWAGSPNCNGRIVDCPPDGVEKVIDVPSFSTDPTAVFAPGGLVDAMLAKGYLFCLYSNAGPQATPWEANFIRAGDGFEFEYVGPTPSAAVASAAAAALRGAETRTDAAE